MPLSFLIRPVTRADLPALEWEGAYTHFRNLFAAAFRDSQQGRNVLWVAVSREEGRLIGQAFVQLTSLVRPQIADGVTRAYVFSVRVRPELRSRGVGTQLMKTVEADLAQRGMQFVTLNVAVDNPAGYRFYRRLGYHKVGDEPGQWSYIDHRGERCHVNEPAWRLEKALR